MPAVCLNAGLILLGSLLGLLLQGRISQRLNVLLTQALGLCVVAIGTSTAIATEDTLCVIVCMVAGAILGELLQIEARLDAAAGALRARLARGEGSGRFTEGFVTASVLFCVGSMAIMGTMEAGIQGRYAILVSKSVIDGVAAITFASAMGLGVVFSALPLFLYEGALCLLFAQAGPLLSTAAVTEMSAVGGAVIVGIGINMLGLGRERLRVGDLLPAIFLPLLYLPLAERVGALLG